MYKNDKILFYPIISNRYTDSNNYDYFLRRKFKNDLSWVRLD